jgi:hypothetical protein
MDKKPLKQKLLRIISIIVIVIFIFYLFLFAFFPVLLVGLPGPLYSAYNFDTENHTLTISVLDSTNKTILFQSYNIQPDKSIKYDRVFGLYPTITWTPFTWSEGKYTFIAVLDSNYTASVTRNIHMYETISIHIQFEDTPLEILISSPL